MIKILIDKLFQNKILVLFFFTALSVRLCFVFFAADQFYHHDPYLNNDSYSFMDAFLNLYQKGIYSFDLQNKDAYFGRLPGYPFFWGISFLIFGKYSFISNAVLQCLLDSVAVVLVFQIILKITDKKNNAYLGALIYVFYPFSIIWVSKVATESFATFLTILFFYFLYVYKENAIKPIMLGFVVALCFYTREYLGILIVSVVIFYYYTNSLPIFIKKTLIAVTTFVLLYSIWPLRNYLSFNRIILVKTITSGYERYGEDIVNIRSWIYCWTNDADELLYKISNSTDTNLVSPSLFNNKQEYFQFNYLISKARACGTGTYHWKHYVKYPYQNNCNDEISNGFIALKQSYIKNNPFQYYIKVPLLNLKKALFKNSLSKQSTSTMVKLLFGYRTLLILLSVLSILILVYKKVNILPLAFFAFFMYMFISFGLRQMEMRYLLQADCILLIIASYPLYLLYTKTRFLRRHE